MRITVKGVEVRSGELEKEIILRFNFEDLNEEGQKRLLLENKDLFAHKAIRSKYESIRKLALELKNEYTSKVLNEIIRRLEHNENSKDIDLLLEFLSTPNLKLKENLRKILSESGYHRIREWVANSSQTKAMMLEDMFYCEFTGNWEIPKNTIISGIIRNPNFVLSEYTKQCMKEIDLTRYDMIMKLIEELKPVS